MQAGNYRDATNLLEKSLTTNRQLQGEDSLSNCDILRTLAKVMSKIK